ncbi:MAG: 5'-3' exonuclease, partial [Cyclobacteriaceae bacterium]
MMPGDHKIFFLDAYALIFRAYYAFIRNPRVNTKGLNTSAIFGFTNTLLEILNNERPTHVAAVFDPQTKTFRHDIYSEYKANRESTPEDIKQAVPYIKKILKAFGIPVIQIDGFEADDIIGTLATKACKAGYTSYMMTSDKDYAQLVRDNLFIYKPRSSGAGVEILGVNEIKEKYG